MARIQVKVYYAPSGDIRRLSFPENALSLTKLREAVLSNNPVKLGETSVQLKYKDNEGDWVTLGSDDELLDALTYSNPEDPVLRIQASFPKNFDLKFNPVDPLAMFGEVSKMAEQFTPFVKDLFESNKECIKDLNEFVQQNATKIGSNLEDVAAGIDVSALLNQFKNILEPLTQQTQPRPQPQPQTQQQPGEARQCPFNRRPFVAKRMNEFCFRQGLDHAIREMNRQNYSEAETILFHLAESHPEHELVYYNLACLYSLIGNVERAVENLEKAVALGYKNIDWLKADSDLNNIRHTLQYQEIVARFSSPQPQPQPQPELVRTPIPTPTPEPVSVPEPEPVACPVPETPKVDEDKVRFARELELLHDMGLVNDEVNVQLLKKWNGNINRVVNEAFNI